MNAHGGEGPEESYFMQELGAARAVPVVAESFEALIQTKAGGTCQELPPADASRLKLTVRPERDSPVLSFTPETADLPDMLRPLCPKRVDVKAPRGRALRVRLDTCCRMTHHRIAVRALALPQERKTVLVFTFVGNCSETGYDMDTLAVLDAPLPASQEEAAASQALWLEPDPVPDAAFYRALGRRLVKAGRPELAGEYTATAEYFEKVTRPELTRLYAQARAAALAGDSRGTTLAVARLLSYSEAFGFYVQKLGADPAFAGFVRSPEFQRMGPSERCCEVRESGIGDDGAPHVRVTRYREGKPESTRFEPPP